MINQDRMIFGDSFVNFEPIFLKKIAEAIVYKNPNRGKKFAKLYLIFQKVDHLPYNNILELV